MKKIFLCFLVLLPTCLLAQKHDNVWIIGYNNYRHPTYKGSLLRFDNDTLQVLPRLKEANVGIGANASICDAAGNLVFFTNGYTIFNANADTVHRRLLYGRVGYSPIDGCYAKQSNMFLPMPNQPNQYVLLSVTPAFDYISFRDVPFYIAFDSLQYTLLDATANNGMGGVIRLKQPLLAKQLDPNSMEICRHGNGRDWWILVSEDHSNITHRILLDPTGFHYIGSQAIGNILSYDYGFRFGVFSPNGEWLIRYASDDRLDSNDVYLIGRKTYFYRFDRCSGLLSSPFQINNLRDTTWGGGVAISPNSRFLYVVTNSRIFQYDLQALNIPASEQLIGTWDRFADSLGWTTAFFYPQLAPNGKIYISTIPPTQYMHVIHAPDSQGVACRLEQRNVLLKTYNRSISTFPHYRMGHLSSGICDTCSACDTLRTSSAEVPLTEGEVKIYPNPAQDYFEVSLPTGGVVGQSLLLYDVLGRKVHQTIVREGEKLITVQLPNLPNGIYWLQCTINGQYKWTHKILISK